MKAAAVIMAALLIGFVFIGCASYQFPAPVEYQARGKTAAAIVKAAEAWVVKEFALEGVKVQYSDPAVGKLIVKARIRVPMPDGEYKYLVVITIEAVNGRYKAGWTGEDCSSMFMCKPAENKMKAVFERMAQENGFKR